MKIFKIFSLMGFLAVILMAFNACEADSTIVPTGGSISCSPGADIDAFSGSLGSITAQVFGTDGLPINSALVDVRLNSVGAADIALFDSITGAQLPDRFFTNTNDSGLVKVDMTCELGIAEQATCSVFFDVGTTGCSTELVLNMPDAGT